MLDKILLRLKEEVAMDGYQGTSINDMWTYVQRFLSEEVNRHTTDDKIEPVVDNSYKRYFWAHLRYVTELSFFDQAHLPSVERQVQENATQKKKDSIEVDYSCIENLVQLEYDQVESQYGSQLRVVADRKLQEAQLFVDVPIGQSWSPDLKNLLTTILQSRQAGVTQAQLTNIWNLDSRSTGHFVKSLQAKGAITRTGVIVNSTRTNLCIHIRFNKGETVLDSSAGLVPNNMNMMGVIFSKKIFEERVTELLTDAKDHTMFSTDIMSALGFDLSRIKVRKWFNRTIDTLCQEGTVRKLSAQTVNSRREARCIQLLGHKSNESAKESDDDDRNGLISSKFTDLTPCLFKGKSENNCSLNSRFLHGAPLEYQILKLVEAAGEQGLTQRDIGVAMRCDNTRIRSRAMERLSLITGDAKAKYGIERVLEFGGRNRRYRYYTYINFLKVHENKTVEMPVYQPFKVDESKLQEIDRRKFRSEAKARRTGGNSNTKKKKPVMTDDYESDSSFTVSSPASLDHGIVRKTPVMFLRSSRSTAAIPSSSNQEAVESPSSTISPSSTLPSTSQPEKKKRGRPRKNVKGDPADNTRLCPQHTSSDSDTITGASSLVDNLVHLSEAPTLESPRQDCVLTTLPIAATSCDNNEINNNNDQPSATDGCLIQPLPVEHTHSTSSPAAQIAVETAQPQPVAETLIDSSSADRIHGGKRRTQELDRQPAKKKARSRQPVNTITGYFQKSTSPQAASSQSSQASSPRTEAKADTRSQQPSELPSQETSLATDDSLLSQPLKEESANDTPSVSDVSTTVTQKRFTRVYQRNKYLEERKEIILAMLEDKHIIEKGVEGKTLFADKKKELYGIEENAHLIDGKTLWRSVESLAKEGKLHTREGQVLLLNGKQSMRKVMIHRSMDPNGPEVNAHFEYMKERRVLQPRVTKPEVIQKTDVSVEGLDERLARMEKAMEKAAAANKVAEAKRIDAEIQLIKDNAARSGETYNPFQPKKMSNWLLAAMQFGYSNSRFVRLKLFHQYLLGILTMGTGIVDGLDQEKRLIPTKVMIYNMTLSFSCKIIGVFKSTDKFREYIEDESHANVRLSELPNDVRGCVFSEKNKFRYRLRLLLDFLIRLGVAEMVDKTVVNEKGETVEADSRLHLGLAYRLTPKTSIRNYRLPDRPIIQEHSLNTQADALMYWSELQYVCTKSDLAEGEEATIVINKDEEWIRSLYTVKNWSTTFFFTKEQSKELNRHVDVEAGKTPLHSTTWCQTIADELGVSVEVIRGYYRKAEEAMDRSSKRPKKEAVIPPKRSLRPRQQPQQPKSRRSRRRQLDSGVVSEKNKLITLSTTKPFKFKNPALTKSQRLAREQGLQQQFGEDGYANEISKHMDDDASIPFVQENLISNIPLTRSKRKSWNTEEDDLLKLCYVILNHRKQSGTRFTWKPVQKLLPKFTNNQIGRRYKFIRDIPRHVEDIRSIRVKWHYYYKKGIQEGVLTGWQKVDDYDFGLLEYVAYYLQQLQLEETNGIQVDYFRLPASKDIVHENFDIDTIIATHNRDAYPEDAYHNHVSIIKMRRSLCNQISVQRVNTAESYDIMPTEHLMEMTRDGRRVELLKLLFKMILMTPLELYDPFYANSLITSFPEELVNIAIQQSRNEGLLVKAKGDRGTDRRIPKTLLGISERFLRKMTARLPKDIWMNAIEYENHLRSVGSCEVDPVALTSGMMASILELVSSGNLYISITNFDDFVIKHNKPSHSSRRLKESNSNYGISLSLFPRANFPMEIDTTTASNAQHGSMELATSDVQRQYDMLPLLVQTMTDYLESQHTRGATLVQIKQALLNEYKVIDLSDELFLAAVHVMTQQLQPPLATFVGFCAYRLVLTTKLDSWVITPNFTSLIHTEGAPGPENDTGVDKAVTSHEAIDHFSHTEEERTAMDHRGIHCTAADDQLTEIISPSTQKSTAALDNSSTHLPTSPPRTGDNENGDNNQDTNVISASSSSDEQQLAIDDSLTTTEEKPAQTSTALCSQQIEAIKPRTWIDINGRTTISVWMGCVDLIVDTIMHRPGVTFGQLCRLLKSALQPVEIQDLINALTQNGVLRQLSVLNKAPSTHKSNLFSPKCTLHTATSNTIDTLTEKSQTSYWIVPGFYNKSH